MHMENPFDVSFDRVIRRKPQNDRAGQSMQVERERRLLSRKIKAIKVHDFRPCRDKVVYKLLFRVI